MTLTEICTTREQSERLKKAGYPQDKSCFVWMKFPGRIWVIFERANITGLLFARKCHKLPEMPEVLAAPTLEELWQECGKPNIQIFPNSIFFEFETINCVPVDYQEINCKDLKSALVELYCKRGK